MRFNRVVWVLLVLVSLGGGCRKEPPQTLMSLHEAVAAGNLSQVRELLSDGADANARDDRGCTALHVAARLYHEPVVKVGEKSIIQLLLATGADVDAGDENGATPLHHAAFFGHTKAAKQLLAGGANPNARHLSGQTPLHKAIVSGCMELIERLIARGADVNAADRDGWTPVHFAASYGHTDAYDFLVARGADLSIRTNEGRTPPDLAREAADRQVVVLSDGKDEPYAMIITNPGETAQFLWWNGIDFDRVWIPDDEDVGWTISVLRVALNAPAELPAPGWFRPEYVRAHLHQYNRQYSGFTRNGRKHLIANMYISDTPKGEKAPFNGFARIYDGGGIAVRGVFDVETRTLTYIECNGQ